MDTNTAFVTALYRDLLKREPDAEGLSHWVAKLENDELTTQEVVAYIAADPKARTDLTNLMQPARIRKAFIVAVYNALLGRAPENTGLNFWDKAIAGGLSAQAFQTTILQSQEYFDKVTANATVG